MNSFHFSTSQRFSTFKGGVVTGSPAGPVLANIYIFVDHYILRT